MQYGIISDIHGNLDALDAVLKVAGRRVDGWICLGDTVGYGPEPNECVDRVRDLCDPVLVGNHDLAAIRQLDASWFNPVARRAAEWTREILTEESQAFLKALPETADRPEWGATFAHGSLTDPPRDYITTRPEARKNFKLLQTSVLFIGHSHLSHCYVTPVEGGGVDEEVFHAPTYVDVREEVFHARAHVDIRADHRYIINCGSVGQPRDGDPKAAYGIFDPDNRTVDIFRVAYDIPSVQKKMRDAGLPEMLADRLGHGY